MSNSRDLFSGLVGLGMAGLVGYGAYKGVEYLAHSQREAEEAERQRQLSAMRQLEYAQQRHQEKQNREVQQHIANVDSAIDELLQDPKQAIQVISNCVVDMDDTAWKIFAGLLARKADDNQTANMLLTMAHYTRLAGEEIIQLISHSVDEAVSLINDIWHQKDEAEQAGFLLALQGKAKSSVKAKAILGRIAA